MRDHRNLQSTMLAFVNLDERVPPDRPLGIIKQIADDVLVRMSYDFDRMYSKIGRASAPPKRLEKAPLLISVLNTEREGLLCQGWADNRPSGCRWPAQMSA